MAFNRVISSAAVIASSACRATIQAWYLHYYYFFLYNKRHVLHKVYYIILYMRIKYIAQCGERVNRSKSNHFAQFSFRAFIIYNILCIHNNNILYACTKMYKTRGKASGASEVVVAGCRGGVRAFCGTSAFFI